MDGETDEAPTGKLEIAENEHLAQQKAIERASAIQRLTELHKQIDLSVKNVKKI